ncbi:hypothetical protein PBRA_000919 [Plasmodiophora brassicae]|uniref:phosphoglycerate mutase (2,3-diphosphoglycerate-independent) n=1 Tax=Plasmodiophora brassicae TaxID=37360 RepID=A0A0G4IQX3_PLABS|nr:hypothetical protein PBRA_000919 [Plasmodiophora brassicae]
MCVRPAVLICIDGWGVTSETRGNAIAAAHTPVMTALSKVDGQYAVIRAHGLDVGLPDGNMGNSEVGHLTIGAGRIEYQDLVRINRSIENGTFASAPALVDAFSRAKSGTKRMHFLGLVSDGGVHSHITHLFELLKAAKAAGVEQCFVHFIADGRDTPPSSATTYLQQVLDFTKELQYGTVATVMGRFYAMDRDKRWDRIEKAFRCILCGQGDVIAAGSPVSALEKRYEAGETDEFLKPMIFDRDGIVHTGDTLVCFNFRADRMREIVEAIGIAPPFDTKGYTVRELRLLNVPTDLSVVQFTLYNKAFSKLPVVVPPDSMDMTLAEVVASRNLAQAHVAETEKYAHVTFFFNGGKEAVLPNEDRVMIPSPKHVATYDLAPTMSVAEVADAVCTAIASKKYAFIVCNLAPPDMVGHTGNYKQTVVACEATDTAIGRILDACNASNTTLFITADHGNAEVMLDEQGNPKTSHTTNPVPFIMTGDNRLKFRVTTGGLQDVAPTILRVMGLPVPEQMTGKSMLLE